MNPTQSAIQNPKSEIPEWYVRPYEPGDEPELLALYERAFGKPRTEAHWRWKWTQRTAPFNLIWVAALPRPERADHDEREHLVGHYGAIPLRMKFGDDVKETVNVVEAMTNPLYRRQGMLTRMVGEAHAAWADAGQIVTGLPNDQWGSRNHVLGYRPVLTLDWLRFPLHLERSIARRISLPAILRPLAYISMIAISRLWVLKARLAARWRFCGGQVNVQLPDLSTTVFDDIWANASQGWQNLVVRDDDWVRWRFLQARPVPYTIRIAKRQGQSVGYIAYRLIEDGERKNGHIADLFVARGDSASAAALVDVALRDLSAGGAEGTVTTLAPRGSYLYGLLRQLGFLRTPSSTAFSFEIVPPDESVSVADLSDPRFWHLTGGDFDVI